MKDDLISRNSLLQNIVKRLGIASEDYFTAQESVVISCIYNEPSAQPEILTCENCKYADDKPISNGRHWCSIHGSFMYYCSDAERREE